MRNDLTPQVETSEIDDSDLDGISGGFGVDVRIDGHLLCGRISENIQVTVVPGMHMHHHGHGHHHHHG